MAYVLRLIACALLVWCGAVGASVPLQKTEPFVWAGDASNKVFGSDPAGACTSEIALRHSTYTFTSVTLVTWSAGQCFGKTGSVSPVNVDNIHAVCVKGSLNQATHVCDIAPQCPANSTASGSACTCNAGYVEGSGSSIGTCVLPPDPCKSLAGQDAGDWVKDKGVNAAGTGPESRSWSVCNAYTGTGGGKCVVTVSNATCDEVGFGSGTEAGSGFYRCVGRGFYTGTSAIAGKCDATSSGKGSGDSPADPSPATPPVPGSDPPKPPSPKPADGLPAPAPCPAGQASGSVNGTTACYPTGSDSPKAGGKDSSTTNSDGSKETKHEETTCNAGGSKCSTDTTTCTTPAGGTTATCSTTTTTDTAKGTCQKSPGNSVCAGGGNGSPGSSFGGDCKAGFKAVGEDPVLNAMAQEQFTRNCQFFDTTGPVSQQYAVETAKTGDQTGNLPGNFTQDLSGGADMTDALGGGGCPSDQNIPIPIGGRTFTLSLALSKSCQGLGW